MHTSDTVAPREGQKVAGWIGLGLLVLLGGAAVWLRGSTFYLLSSELRFDHPDYRLLSPTGPVGQGYGVIASVLVVANLSYLLRRRFARWRVGSMRAWLDIHVATGVLAGLFGLSHSALQLRNPVAAVTMVSLTMTLVTGVIGRFLFLFVPRADIARLEQLCLALDALGAGLGRALLQQLNAMPLPQVTGRVTLPKVLWLQPRWWREARKRRLLVRSAVEPYRALHPDEYQLLKAHVAETAALAANASRAVSYDYLMRSWRGFHRFFALLMLALLVVHIGVAWYYGYRWIFSKTGTGL
jgi:dihydropyrimidine dehydrogenase (NAD+) subunit PreT